MSNETQATLLALVSGPLTEQGGGNSFSELVEEATIEQSAVEGDGADEPGE